MTNKQIIKFYVDTETYKIKEGNDTLIKPYLYGVVYENQSYAFFNTFEFCEFLKSIFLKYGSENYRYEMFFYNASYDLTVIITELQKQKYMPFSRLEFDNQENFFQGWFCFNNLKFYIYVIDLWTFNKTMKLKDYTIKLFPDDKTVWKGEIDYDKWNVKYLDKYIIEYNNTDGTIKTVDLRDNELYYLHNDVFIMPYIDEDILHTINTAFSLFNAPAPSKRFLTIGSLSKALFDYWLTTQNSSFEIFRAQINDDLQQLRFQRGYVGGLTFRNINYNHYQGEIYSIDVNSMYPFIMWNTKLPYGKPIKNKPHFDNQNYMIADLVTFKKIKYKEKYSWLGKNLIDIKMFKSRYISREYLNLILETCEVEMDYNVKDTVFFKTTDIQKTFIEKLYELKQNAQGKQRVVAKLILNTLYGKMAEKKHDEKHIFVLHEDNGFYLELIKDETQKNKNVFAGSYITQMARIKLFEAIKLVLKNGGEVLYGDTDSLTITIDPRTISGLLIDKTKMGYWDIENVYENEVVPYTDMYLLNVDKKYFIYNKNIPQHYKLAFSGVDKNYIASLSDEIKLIIFNPKNNVLIKNKSVSARKNKYSQKELYNSDFQTNSGLKKITHILDGEEIYEQN